jgi:hypothetical protein
MLPTALLVQNFRSFAGPEPTRLELRPITLLFGRNGGGKSSLVRGLPLLADALGHDGLDALNLEGRLSLFDLDFDSLRWKGRAETDERTIGLGLRWEGDPEVQEVMWAIGEQDDWHRLVVERLSVQGQAGAPLLSAEWRLTRGERAKAALTYDLRLGDAPGIRESIAFRGLLPVAEGSSCPDALSKFEARLGAVANSVLWLHSLRPAPQRYTRWQGAVRWSLDPDGRDAPIVLAGEPSLQEEVSAWYADIWASNSCSRSRLASERSARCSGTGLARATTWT